MRNNGIDSIIDQWELKPGDDLPHFMETHLSNADKIIMICSDKYVEKANSGTGGVGYEKMILTSNLLKNIDQNKIIPVIRQDATKTVPTFLSTKLYIDFSLNLHYEFAYDELIRTIHNSPIYKKPPIGNNPFENPSEKPAQKQHDGVNQVMKALSDGFNATTNTWVTYSELRKTFGGSRILLDFLLDEIVELGYVRRDSDGDFIILPDGKIFIINNNLG